ncbi:MAG: hypothetical protein A2W31_05430 [Planctomycetes bacterium RBG_16_64_10]|nr:MAG: hypothetical protein A2W31_05430 [Planctomycetes bacterium RBG_16_64_10]
MDSRQAILNALATDPSDSTPLPALDEDWVKYDDVVQQLADTLALVGGQMRIVADRTQLRETLNQMDLYRRAATVCCLLPDMANGSVDSQVPVDPDGLQAFDVMIVPGAFAVAENAAVWVTDEHVQERALYFLAEHLVLVVPQDQIVHNMHEAYARLALDEWRFGVFISGPSKTADIEQTLVMGAQGPRSLTLLLVGS